MDDIASQLIKITCPLNAVSSKKQSKGTGFFYNFWDDSGSFHMPFLVTCEHVVKDCDVLYIGLRIQGTNPVEMLTISVDKDYISQFSASFRDVFTVPIGPVINQIGESGKSVDFKALDNTISNVTGSEKIISAIEPILFIGYPSGIFDLKTMYPIVRNGITATPAYEKFNGETEFLIDAGVHGGSSGSPVFVFNNGSFSSGNTLTIGTRLIFLGMVKQQIKSDRDSILPDLGVVENSESIVKILKNHHKIAGQWKLKDQ